MTSHRIDCPMMFSCIRRAIFRRRTFSGAAVTLLALSAAANLAAGPPAAPRNAPDNDANLLSREMLLQELGNSAPAPAKRPKFPSRITQSAWEYTQPMPGDAKQIPPAPPYDASNSSEPPLPQPASTVDPAGIGASVDVVPADEEQWIDLGTALQLAETANPQIAISRQGVQTAMALQLGARGLALPHIRLGFNFHLHNNVLQTSFGLMRHVNSRSFYIGGGASTLAAETLALPAVQIDTHLGEAIYAPLAARQQVYASQYDTQATINEVFLEVSTRYLELMAAEAILKAIQQSEQELGEVARLTDAYAKSGRGRVSDARRARTEALLARLEEERAQEAVAVASAELCRVLHLDPSVRLKSPGGAIAMVDLVDPDQEITNLVELAQSARPELTARRFEIQERDYEYRQARTRPLFPDVQVRFSGGGFAGGTNRKDLVPVSPGFGRMYGRTDLDLILYWQLDNLGMGNIASTRQKRSEREVAMLEWHQEQATIREEVVVAYGRMEQAREAVKIAERKLGNAERGFQEDLRRIQGGVGLPVEVLDSMDLLIEARNALIEATANYDIAQFELYVAIGQTPEAAVVQQTEAETN